ncbi:predicted protein [Botrytis cinerea T4]|uniref:Uncharacterized protein n=1 Tax=Botryotinia fuckeliana (strain T4) TaxID=999810 RepID=G2Y299_BOTF4|nr:predicted protein [Botrytis cinerea T4]
MVAVSECSDDEKLSNENPSVDNFALIKLQFSHSGNRLLWHLDTQNQRGGATIKALSKTVSSNK